MLFRSILSEEVEGREITLAYGRQCLESLRRSDDQRRSRDLKVRIKEAERAGNTPEVMALLQELQSLERSGGART